MKQQTERMLICIENKKNQCKPVCSCLLLFIVINAALTKICFCVYNSVGLKWLASIVLWINQWLAHWINFSNILPVLPSCACFWDYNCCNALFFELPLKTVWRFQLVQKEAVDGTCEAQSHFLYSTYEISWLILYVVLVTVFFKTFSGQDRIRLQ